MVLYQIWCQLLAGNCLCCTLGEYPVFVDLKVKSHVPIQRKIIALSLMLSKFLSVDHIKGLVSGLSEVS